MEPLRWMAHDGGPSHHPKREQWDEACLGEVVDDPRGYAVQHRSIRGRLNHGAAHPAYLLADPLREGVGCVGLDDCVRNVDHAMTGCEDLGGEVAVFVGNLWLLISTAWPSEAV